MPDVITEREEALYRAMLALDYTALDGLLSDDIRYVHSTGVVETKAGYFAGLREGLYEYGAITRISGCTTQSGSMAFISGVIDMNVGAKGSEKNVIRLQDVLIWREEAGVWRLLLRQATRIPA